MDEFMYINNLCAIRLSRKIGCLYKNRITMGKNHITKIMIFFINMYDNHNKLTFHVLSYVVTYIESSVECR